MLRSYYSVSGVVWYDIEFTINLHRVIAKSKLFVSFDQPIPLQQSLANTPPLIPGEIILLRKTVPIAQRSILRNILENNMLHVVTKNKEIFSQALSTTSNMLIMVKSYGSDVQYFGCKDIILEHLSL